MSGKLGSADLAATTNTSLGTMAVDGIVNVLLTNRNSTAVQVRVAITSGGAPAAADWVEYDAPVGGNGILERTGLSCSAGEAIYVYASATGVSARAHFLPSA